MNSGRRVWYICKLQGYQATPTWQRGLKQDLVPKEFYSARRLVMLCYRRRSLYWHFVIAYELGLVSFQDLHYDTDSGVSWAGLLVPLRNHSMDCLPGLETHAQWKISLGAKQNKEITLF